MFAKLRGRDAEAGAEVPVCQARLWSAELRARTKGHEASGSVLWRASERTGWDWHAGRPGGGRARSNAAFRLKAAPGSAELVRRGGLGVWGLCEACWPVLPRDVFRGSLELSKSLDEVRSYGC